MLNKITLLLLGAAAFTASASTVVTDDGLGVKYSKDTHGQRLVDDITIQVSSIRKQMSSLNESYLLEKQKLQTLFVNQMMVLDNKYVLKNTALDKELVQLDDLLSTRQKAINYIEKEHEYRYFTVGKGSFKLQLAKFADRLDIKTVRWAGVPSCVDWELDSTYKIDMSDTRNAIDELLDGMALSYEYFSRDNSLNLTSLVILGDCKNG